MLFSQQDREQYNLDGAIFYPPVWLSLLMDAILLYYYSTILWGTDTERCVGSPIPLELTVEASMAWLRKKSSQKIFALFKVATKHCFMPCLYGSYPWDNDFVYTPTVDIGVTLFTLQNLYLLKSLLAAGSIEPYLQTHISRIIFERSSQRKDS